MARHRLKLLTYDASAVPAGGAAVYAQLTRLSATYGKEPAGHIYHDKALKQAGLYGETAHSAARPRDSLPICRLAARRSPFVAHARPPAPAAPAEAEEEEESDADESSAGASRQGSTADFSSMGNNANGGGGGGEDEGCWKGKGKRKGKAKKAEGMDLYALLGLQNERHEASHEQIRKAYRAAALEHHPDKTRAAAGDDAALVAASEDRFKAIQEAYETLTDPAKRREFDSTDAHDDSLPGEADAPTPEAFYAAFGAAFRRNAKWSVNQPVPDLGGDEASPAEVEHFYEFWFSLRSWREFSHPDEEDIEQAEGRDHRRYIERYNAKLREKGKKDEFRRVRDFVELAHSLDPRVRRAREEAKAARDRRKADKAAERAAAAAAEVARAEAEAARAAQDEVAAAEAKKARQVEKKALQKERSKLRKLCAPGGGGPPADEDDVELLCASLDLPTISALCAALAAADLGPADKEAALAARLSELQASAGEASARREAAHRAVAAAAQRAAQAEAEERAARLRQWSEEEVRLLRKALDRFPPGTAKRWDTVQAYVRTRTVDEVVDMVKHGLKSGAYDAAPTAGHTIAKKRQANVVIHSEATARVEVFSDVEVQLQGEAAAVLTPAAAAAAAAAAAEAAPEAAAAAAPAAAAPAAEWREAEEVALVKALKDVPKDAADRWERVAAAVGSKGKAQCARRFKEMKEKFKAKKAGAA
jgi:DnaJ family protein C protein 2